MDMFLYESVSCVCLCLSDEPVLFCIYVWTMLEVVHMFGWHQGSCKRTGSPSLDKVFELN